MEINFKRFLSFMLALAMVLSYVPVSVFAEETVTDDTSIVSEDVPDEDDSTPVDPDEDNITPVDLDEDDDTTFESGTDVLVTLTIARAEEVTVDDVIERTVARIGDDYFMSLTEALDAANSGETVILLTSTEDTYIIVSPGVTLNLAGHTLTAEKVIGFKGSNVVDNTREGLLKVAEESVIVLSESNSEMAFWTGEGYKFGIFRPVSVAAPVLNEDGSLAFQFYTQISGKLQSLVTDNGTSDNNVSVVIRLTWNTATGTAYQNFVYNDEQVSLVGAGDYSATFTLDNYAELSGLTLTAVIVSETGVEAVAETYQITE